MINAITSWSISWPPRQKKIALVLGKKEWVWVFAVTAEVWEAKEFHRVIWLNPCHEAPMAWYCCILISKLLKIYWLGRGRGVIFWLTSYHARTKTTTTTSTLRPPLLDWSRFTIHVVYTGNSESPKPPKQAFSLYSVMIHEEAIPNRGYWFHEAIHWYGIHNIYTSVELLIPNVSFL